MIRDPNLYASYIESVDHVVPGVAFQRSGLDSFFKTSDEYHWKMAVLVHLTSGMPARATELVTNVIRTSRDSIRTVFFAEGYIYLCTHYNKSNSSTERSNLIARFLPKNVSRMILLDILYVCNW